MTQNLFTTLRQLNAEASGLKAISSRTTRPYAAAICSLTETAYSQAAAVHLDAMRSCRDMFIVGSVSWKLLDEALTATTDDEEGALTLQTSRQPTNGQGQVKVGSLVNVKNYGGTFILAEIRPEEAMATVRDIEFQNPIFGRFGTTPHARQRDGYLWFSVPLSDITTAEGQAPDVVTAITFAQDEHGPYKLAQVSGRDLPFVNYHNPNWTDFFKNLHDAGIIVPEDTPMCFDAEDCGTPSIPIGIYPLKNIVEALHTADLARLQEDAETLNTPSQSAS